MPPELGYLVNPVYPVETVAKIKNELTFSWLRVFVLIHEKYYLGDIGLRNAVLGYRESAINGLLENLVFLELKRRGYQIGIGKLGEAEIDFIATKQQDRKSI